MKKEKAVELLEKIEELKAIKKEIKGWAMDIESVIIDTDLETYLKGVSESE